jgi:LDH2 family malate/lactate/ureidoglycolate dehydrogenase
VLILRQDQRYTPCFRDAGTRTGGVWCKPPEDAWPRSKPIITHRGCHAIRRAGIRGSGVIVGFVNFLLRKRAPALPSCIGVNAARFLTLPTARRIVAPMSGGSNYLDPNRPGAVRLSVRDARALGEAALARIGYGENDACIITDQLIDNSLCGYRFAGLPRILAIAREAKTKNTRTPIAVVHETPVSALVDGGNNVGYVAVYRGAEIAIAKAKQSGVAAVGIFNSYFSGRNAYYLERIVNAGFVGLHTASGSPHIVPPGATRPALGTNPIAFGFPSAGGPVIFDIGTASLMWGEVLLAAETGEELPRGLAFDADGNPTVDGRAAARGGVAAFGGHKGYGLAFAIQALGLLAGAAIPRGQVQDYGFLFLVVDPGVLLPENPFAAQMAQLVKAIQATPRQPGVEEIRIPSQHAFRERERRRAEGILVDEAVIAAIEAL